MKTGELTWQCCTPYAAEPFSSMHMKGCSKLSLPRAQVVDASFQLYKYALAVMQSTQRARCDGVQQV